MPADTTDFSSDVSPVELFFDLVFVFAMSQLSHHLLAHLDWRGAAETLVMLLAVFTVWGYTTFETTLVHTGRTKAWMLLAVMWAGLFMNASIGHAFGASAWAFMIPLLAIQFGRTSWTLRAARPELQEHYWRVLVWFGATAPLWIIGAASGPDARLAWWGAAVAIDLAGMWLAHPVPRHVLHSEAIAFDAQHLVERCRLLLIIALGEAVLTTGTAVANTEFDTMTALTGTCALISVVSLWALYFASSDSLVDRQVDSTSNPVMMGRFFLDAESIGLAALIIVAVANELVISHPHGETPVQLALLLFGGPLLYVALQLGYLKLALGAASPARAIALPALLAGGFLALVLPAWAALTLLAAMLIVLVAAVLREDRLTRPAR